MHTFTSRRLTAALLIIGTVLWFSCFRNGDGSWITSPTSPTDPDALLDSRIRNSTLGFQKIFAIGFKERTDKHDAIALAASYTGLEVDWFEGVRAANIPPKAYPAVWTEEKHRDKPAELGSWRAHMNALRQYVIVW